MVEDHRGGSGRLNLVGALVVGTHCVTDDEAQTKYLPEIGFNDQISGITGDGALRHGDHLLGADEPGTGGEKQYEAQIVVQYFVP